MPKVTKTSDSVAIATAVADIEAEVINAQTHETAAPLAKEVAQARRTYGEDDGTQYEVLCSRIGPAWAMHDRGDVVTAEELLPGVPEKDRGKAIKRLLDLRSIQEVGVDLPDQPNTLVPGDITPARGIGPHVALPLTAKIQVQQQGESAIFDVVATDEPLADDGGGPVVEEHTDPVPPETEAGDDTDPASKEGGA